MAGRNKQPVDVIEKRGKTHLTKAEKERRKEEELQIPDRLKEVRAPDFLELISNGIQDFNRYAQMLTIVMPTMFGEPDADLLARYIVAQHQYEKFTLMLEKSKDAKEIKVLQIAQDRAFKQAHTCSSSLGLTVTSRCKLVVPVDDGDIEAAQF
ncbi:P27 family phage terminase small subunit [Eggerthellaceae bacterium 3-80]|nr:phage terminase small subunit P27 family [bacterium D16-34]